MKKSDIPFNMEYDLDPKTLHEIPVNEDDMKKGLQFLHQKLKEETAEPKKASIHSLIGAYARIIGELETAENSCETAINFYAEKERPVHLMLAKVRLAAVMHFRKMYGKSEAIYKDVLSSIPGSADKEKYKDHVHQSYGKLLVEMKMLSNAMEQFVQAFEIRLQRGDVNLIQSSQKAMDLTNALIDAQEGVQEKSSTEPE